MRMVVSPEHERGTPLFEYDRITPTIWVGTNRCCTTHFSRTLRALGIQADISLEAEQLDAAYGAKFFLWLPVRDHRAPTFDQLRVGARALEDLTAARVRTYVHCRNGHGRATTLVAAYLILARRMLAPEAIRYVCARRRGAHIEPTQQRALERFVVRVTENG